MLKLDHYAIRTNDRDGAVNFYVNVFNYRIQKTFDIFFNDEDKTTCTALEPPDKFNFDLPHVISHTFDDKQVEYFLAPEIFISSGGAIVSEWVKQHGSGVHHMAYLTTDIEKEFKKWQASGIEFSSDKILTCDGLKQIFTKQNPYTGIVYELIEREEFGFCQGNVKNLILGSKTDLK